MLSLNGVWFSYEKQWVLQDITLELGKGLHALVGRNGSGKTTLLRVVAGLLTPQRGGVVVCGERIAVLPRRRIASLVALLPQEQNPSLCYRVLEMVLMGGARRHGFFGSPSAVEYERARAVLESLGITELAEKSWNAVSGGQRRLVLLARALFQDAKVLLLDEPTSHLDTPNRLILMRLLRRIVEEHELCVLFSTHDPNETLLWADTAILLDGGRLHAYGSPDDVLSPKMLSDLWKVPVRTVDVGGRFLIVAGMEDVGCASVR